MKRFFIILLVCLPGYNCFAQNQATVIRIQAMEMVKALLRKDFIEFCKYMHPEIIKMAGGKDKLIRRMDTANTMATQFGAKIKKVLIGDPARIVKYKSELQTTLPQMTDLETLLGRVSLQTTLIAISIDGGKNWYFIDTSVYNENEIKKSLPDISPELVIPPVKQPKFIQEK